MTQPRPLRLGRFPEKEMLAIPEREQGDVIHDFLALLNREEGDVTVPRSLAVEVARLLQRVKRKGKGKPPKTYRERSWDENAVWNAKQRKNQLVAQGMSKEAAAWEAADEVTKSDQRPNALSREAIFDAMGRKSRLPK